jgi:hypothetical protein
MVNETSHLFRRASYSVEEPIVIAMQVKSKNGREIWCRGLLPPYWCTGYSHYLTHDEIEEHLGTKWLNEHKEWQKRSIKDQIGMWVTKGEYVIENRRENCLKILPPTNPPLYWTRKGWSDSPIFEEIDVFLLKGVLDDMVFLESLCVITSTWVETKPQKIDEWKMKRWPGWTPHSIIDRIGRRQSVMQSYVKKEKFSSLWIRLPHHLKSMVDRFVEDNKRST